MNNVDEIVKNRATDGARLQQQAPALYEGFNDLMKHYYKPGATSRREKELMAVACSVATRCVHCLAIHANNAVAAGATADEVFDAAAIGVEFGGGPSYVTVRDHLLGFMEDIAEINAKK